MKNILSYFFVIALFQMSFSQSAWVREKGELYTQLAFNDISNYDRIFDKNSDGDFFTGREITDRTIQFYNEYGLTDKVSLIASIPFKLTSTGDLVDQSSISPVSIDQGNLNAFGNIDIAVRRLLYTNKFNLSGQFQIGLPTYSFDDNTGLRTGINSWVFNPSLAIGKGGNKWFLQSNFGLLFRTNDYSNGLRFYSEGGFKILNRIWIIGFVDILDSFENGSFEDSFSNSQTFLNLNDSEYGGFGMKFIAEVNNNFGVTTAFGGAFSAHLEAHKASLNVGLYYKFKKKETSKQE